MPVFAFVSITAAGIMCMPFIAERMPPALPIAMPFVSALRLAKELTGDVATVETIEALRKKHGIRSCFATSATVN